MGDIRIVVHADHLPAGYDLGSGILGPRFNLMFRFYAPRPQRSRGGHRPAAIAQQFRSLAITPHHPASPRTFIPHAAGLRGGAG
jgi:hypothetical protein